jgi:hypothetical protein
MVYHMIYCARQLLLKHIHATQPYERLSSTALGHEHDLTPAWLGLGPIQPFLTEANIKLTWWAGLTHLRRNIPLQFVQDAQVELLSTALTSFHGAHQTSNTIPPNSKLNTTTSKE